MTSVLQDWLTAGGTAVGAGGAVIAAAVSAWAALDARKSAEAQRKDAEAASNETKRQGAIALEAMLMDYHRAILAWSDEAISWMAQAHSLTFFDPTKMGDGVFFNRRAECLWQISALIDRGRLFFPNEDPDLHGLHKPKAFRGFSPAVLDQLKIVHHHIGHLNQTPPSSSIQELRREIVEAKRRFVSEVQEVVDPQARQNRLTQILSASTGPAAIRAAVRP